MVSLVVLRKRSSRYSNTLSSSSSTTPGADQLNLFDRTRVHLAVSRAKGRDGGVYWDEPLVDL